MPTTRVYGLQKRCDPAFSWLHHVQAKADYHCRLCKTATCIHFQPIASSHQHDLNRGRPYNDFQYRTAVQCLLSWRIPPSYCPVKHSATRFIVYIIDSTQCACPFSCSMWTFRTSHGGCQVHDGAGTKASSGLSMWWMDLCYARSPACRHRDLYAWIGACTTRLWWRKLCTVTTREGYSRDTAIQTYRLHIQVAIRHFAQRSIKILLQPHARRTRVLSRHIPYLERSHLSMYKAFPALYRLSTRW